MTMIYDLFTRDWSYGQFQQAIDCLISWFPTNRGRNRQCHFFIFSGIGHKQTHNLLWLRFSCHVWYLSPIFFPWSLQISVHPKSPEFVNHNFSFESWPDSLGSEQCGDVPVQVQNRLSECFVIINGSIAVIAVRHRSLWVSQLQHLL